jgi:biopolymer transport protein ExbD
MSKFKKGDGKEMPAISTASLPDIVFMLLFFFMVTTTMREIEELNPANPPEATEIRKMKQKSLVANIYIGIPPKWKQDILGNNNPRVQLNGLDFSTQEISSPGDEINPIIQEFIEEFKKTKTQKEIPKLTCSIKVDENATMGTVTAVKNELRKNHFLKINYTTTKDDD